MSSRLSDDHAVDTNEWSWKGQTEFNSEDVDSFQITEEQGDKYIYTCQSLPYQNSYDDKYEGQIDWTNSKRDNDSDSTDSYHHTVEYENKCTPNVHTSAFNISDSDKCEGHCDWTNSTDDVSVSSDDEIESGNDFESFKESPDDELTTAYVNDNNHKTNVVKRIYKSGNEQRIRNRIVQKRKLISKTYHPLVRQMNHKIHALKESVDDLTRMHKAIFKTAMQYFGNINYDDICKESPESKNTRETPVVNAYLIGEFKRDSRFLKCPYLLGFGNTGLNKNTLNDLQIPRNDALSCFLQMQFVLCLFKLEDEMIKMPSIDISCTLPYKRLVLTNTSGKDDAMRRNGFEERKWNCLPFAQEQPLAKGQSLKYHTFHTDFTQAQTPIDMNKQQMKFSIKMRCQSIVPDIPRRARFHHVLGLPITIASLPTSQIRTTAFSGSLQLTSELGTLSRSANDDLYIYAIDSEAIAKLWMSIKKEHPIPTDIVRSHQIPKKLHIKLSMSDTDLIMFGLENTDLRVLFGLIRRNKLQILYHTKGFAGVLYLDNCFRNKIQMQRQIQAICNNTHDYGISSKVMMPNFGMPEPVEVLPSLPCIDKQTSHVMPPGLNQTEKEESSKDRESYTEDVKDLPTPTAIALQQFCFPEGACSSTIMEKKLVTDTCFDNAKYNRHSQIRTTKCEFDNLEIFPCELAQRNKRRKGLSQPNEDNDHQQYEGEHTLRLTSSGKPLTVPTDHDNRTQPTHSEVPEFKDESSRHFPRRGNYTRDDNAVKVDSNRADTSILNTVQRDGYLQNVTSPDAGTSTYAISYCSSVFANNTCEEYETGNGYANRVAPEPPEDRPVQTCSSALNSFELGTRLDAPSSFSMHQQDTETWAICTSLSIRKPSPDDNKKDYQLGMALPRAGVTTGELVLINTCVIDGFLLMVFLVLHFDENLRNKFRRSANEFDKTFFKIWKHYQQTEFDAGKIIWCLYANLINLNIRRHDLKGTEAKMIIAGFNKTWITVEVKCSNVDCAFHETTQEVHDVLTVYREDGKPLADILTNKIETFVCCPTFSCGTKLCNGELCDGTLIRNVVTLPDILAISFHHLENEPKLYYSCDIPNTIETNGKNYELKLVRFYKNEHFTEKLRVLDDWVYYDNKEPRLCFFDRDPDIPNTSQLASCYYVKRCRS